MQRLYVLVLLALAGLGWVSDAWAQTQNWYFGTQAGLRFTAGVPTPLTDGAMTTYEGCTTMSTPAGQLLAYSNGEQVWDRQHQPMPNGTAGLGGHNSASQTAILLPLPGSSTQVYLFCVDAIDNNLVGGLRYSVLDFTLRGGLGDVASPKGVVLPTPTIGGKVTEKLTAARHANGRDYWIIVHGWQNNAFYSFLLSPSGLSTTPVVSNSGSVHQGSASFFNASNAVGCMRVSPDGRRLALAQRDYLTELFDFNNATGQVSGYVPLQARPYNYGVEFSPNSSRLYVTEVFGGLTQYNLLAGSGSAIANSGVQLASGTSRFGNLQLGPDNRIYITNYLGVTLDVVASPDALGPACLYQPNAVSLGGKVSQNGLPNFPNVFAVPYQLAFTATPACQGQPTSFAGTLTPALTGAAYAWNFGDPASGGANTATGPTPTHAFSAPGTYAVTLTATHATLAAPLTLTQNVTIAPAPVAYLPADTTACGSPVPLRVRGTWPAGSTFRWQDGSTGPSYTATAAGLYSVTVTSPAGCTGQASVRLTILPLPTVSLGPDTLVCSVPVGLRVRGNWPAGSTFRWQDGSTGPTYTAPAVGLYSVTVTTPNGCTATAVRRVGLSPVPVPKLPSDTLACGSPVVLRVKGSVPTGSTFRWQDGSTAPTYSATTGGTYTVVVTSPAGCVGQSTTRLSIAPSPTVSLGADTAVCPLGSFVLRASPQPAGTTYRWQDGSTAPTYAAVGPGTYSVEVRSAAGCRAIARRVAAPLDCPPLIPNIITPNGDPLNETLVLKNMVAADWHLTIFNRWGRQVYERAQYDNNWNAAGQSAGLYYYLLRHNATGQRLQGWVEVVRPE